MPEHKGVLIAGETVHDKLTAITLELLGCGKKLARELGQELSAVLIGSGIAGLAQESIAFGADRVYVVDTPALKDYQAEAYLTALEKLVRQAQPHTVLLGQTSMGRELAPRLAFRLGVAACLDCIELSLDSQNGNVLFTRPVYGGNARAVFTSPYRPLIATIRTKAFSALEADSSRKGEVVTVTPEVDTSQLKARFQNRVKAEVTGIKLEDAEVVISGGRGIGGPEGFQHLEELAKLLKGAVGATRAACDNGWWPTTNQVGLTGKIVAPTLYIAVALSGSSQHMAGCSGSKNIVAVNKDPDANIFKEARFGVVGDYRQVLPAFAQKVKELLAG